MAHTLGRCECGNVHTREVQHCAECAHPQAAHDVQGCTRGRTWKSRPFDSLGPTICYCREFAPIMGAEVHHGGS